MFYHDRWNLDIIFTFIQGLKVHSYAKPRCIPRQNLCILGFSIYVEYFTIAAAKQEKRNVNININSWSMPQEYRGKRKGNLYQIQLDLYYRVSIHIRPIYITGNRAWLMKYRGIPLWLIKYMCCGEKLHTLRGIHIDFGEIITNRIVSVYLALITVSSPYFG